MAETIKVQYTIEPRWAAASYTSTIEIDTAVLEGLDEQARTDRIADIVQDAVNDECSWGFQELGDGEGG